MVGVIRDAVRLYFDLSQGNIDVLCELFPGIIAAIRGQGQPVSQAPAPRPMALQPVVRPADDDDMPALTLKKAASDGAASANFLASAFALVDG